MNKNTQKFISKLFIFILLISFIKSYTIYANTNKPAISSEAAILMDFDTGEILYNKNENKRFYPASITKIMTALLVLENTNLSDELVFSKSAVTDLDTGAVNIAAKEGDKLNLEAALYTLMLKSANDVANALAEYTAGSTTEFAKLMTKRAKSIGAKNTNFVNAHGLTNVNHYTSAYDMALITKEALKNEKFREIIKTTHYTVNGLTSKPSFSISMGHKMLHKANMRYYEGVIGGKTGYTKAAGNTLVTVAKKGDKTFIVVILKSSNTHYEDTKALLDYAFSKYGLITDTSLVKPNINTNISLQTSNVGPTKSEATNVEFSSTGPGVDNNLNTNVEIVESIFDTEAVFNGPSLEIIKEDLETWKQDLKGWRYIKSDGTYARNEKLNIKSYTYYFANDTYMLTSWYKDLNSDWYYMKDSGEMKKSSWVLYKEKWYYLGEDGRMLKNTITPDGYKVGLDGAWVK